MGERTLVFKKSSISESLLPWMHLRIKLEIITESKEGKRLRPLPDRPGQDGLEGALGHQPLSELSGSLGEEATHGSGSFNTGLLWVKAKLVHHHGVRVPCSAASSLGESMESLVVQVCK